MSFFESKVFRGSHTHQWMRLEKLVRKKEVSARDVESEVKIFQKNIFRPGPKAIFKLVRPTVIFHLEGSQAIFELDRQILKKFSNVLETIQEFP